MQLGNYIHPDAMIGPDVRLGVGVFISKGAIVIGKTSIGDNCTIGPYAVIGTPAEKHGYFFDPDGEIMVGDNCIIREFSTIHSGTIRATRLGNNIVMLRGSHVGHDAIIQDGVTLSCNAIVGGEAIIMRGTNLGIGAAIHQKVVVPSYCMVGMNSTITKTLNMAPGETWAGSPARYLKRNEIGLTRAGIESLLAERQEFDRLKNGEI